MNDENRQKREPEDADESVGQEGRRKPRIPAFMLKPAVSKTVVDIEIEIERRRRKRGW